MGYTCVVFPTTVLRFTSWVFRFLKFHTGYYTPDGILVTKPLACAKHYLK